MARKKLDALEKLAKALAFVAPEKFDMSTWGETDVRGCGFTGCAIGWAIHLGIAPEGLTLGGVVKRFPVFGDDAFSDAVAKAYGISLRDTNFLFFHSAYAEVAEGNALTTLTVSKRIAKYVRDNRARALKAKERGV